MKKSIVEIGGTWGDLTTVRHSFALTAITPIAHSQGTVGNDSLIMTERVLDLSRPGSEPEDVPCITGNTLRHALREALCAVTLSLLEIELGSLPLAAQHLLLSGGALGKQSKSFGIADYRELVEMFPYISLFGGGIGSTLLSGKLEVGYGILICRQNSHRVAELCPALTERAQAAPHAQDMRERRVLTRHELDSAKLRDDDGEGEKTQQMIAGYEVICSGASFLWQVGVQLATPIELSGMLAAVGAFAAIGKVGAKSATGHGRVRIESVPGGIELPVDLGRLDPRAVVESMAPAYASLMVERRVDVIRWLSGLK